MLLVAALATLPADIGKEDPRTNATCPFDRGSAYWTGQTQFVNAQTWYVMKCVQGHQFLSKTSY